MPSFKCYNADRKGKGGWLFRERADDLRRDVQEEDGCDERQGEHEDDKRVSRDEIEVKANIPSNYCMTRTLEVLVNHPCKA